jgi:hypothetical protein
MTARWIEWMGWIRWIGWIAGTLALVFAEPSEGFPISREDTLLQNRMAWVQVRTSEHDCDAIFRSATQRARYGPSLRRVERERCRDAASRQAATRSGDGVALEGETLVGHLPHD